MTLRVVVDPGVVVSAVLTSDGTPARVLDAWRRGRFELIVSDALLGELADVTIRPKLAERISPDQREAVLLLLREQGRHQPDPLELDARTEDPNDDYLAALALGSGSDFLVTGDRALLRWRSDAVRVVAPAEFLDVLDEAGGQGSGS